MKNQPTETPKQNSASKCETPSVLGADDAKGTLLKAKGVLPPTPMELALLAATLNTESRRGGPISVEAALTEAASLHVQAWLFFRENSELTLHQFAMKVSNVSLLNRLICELGKIDEEEYEQQKLRLYEKPISAEPDGACQRCGWKYPRRVKDNVRALYLYYAEREGLPQSVGEDNFAKFWLSSQRTDEKGRIYIALHPTKLDHAKSLRAERNRSRSLKGAETKRERVQAPKPEVRTVPHKETKSGKEKSTPQIHLSRAKSRPKKQS